MPSQSSLSRISADQAARYLAEGQFPPGSMGPKIESALRFLDDGGELAVITSPALLAATLGSRGQPAGTRIERAAPQADVAQAGTAQAGTAQAGVAQAGTAQGGVPQTGATQTGAGR